MDFQQISEYARGCQDSQFQPESSIYTTFSNDRFTEKFQDKTHRLDMLHRQFNYHLKVQEDTFLNQVDNKDLIPTEEEIQQLAGAFIQKYSIKQAHNLIKSLFLRLIPQNLLKSKRIVPKQWSQQQTKEAMYRKNPLSKIQANIRAVQTLQNYMGFKKIYLKSIWKQPTDYNNKYDSYRFKMKTYAARTFVFRGYSLQLFRNQLKAHNVEFYAPSIMFSTYLACVIKQAYRFLQDFVMNECCIDIQYLVTHQKRLIMGRLIHCRTTLKPQECMIFHNIIKILYGLGDVTLDQYTTVKFYLILMKGIRLIMIKKIASLAEEEEPLQGNPAKEIGEDTKTIIYQKLSKSTSKLELCNIWTNKLELELINVYKKIQHFTDIKIYFKNKYPQFQKFFEGNGLSFRFRQIVRAALRKLEDIMDENPDIQPKLVQLPVQNTSYVIQSSRGLKARIMLTDLYLDKSPSYSKKIGALIKQINDVVADKPLYNYRKFTNEFNQVKLQHNFKEDVKVEGHKKLTKFYAPTRLKDYQMKPLMRKNKSVLFDVLENEDRKGKKFNRGIDQLVAEKVDAREEQRTNPNNNNSNPSQREDASSTQISRNPSQKPQEYDSEFYNQDD